MPAIARVRWGVLGAANIALQQVIPATQRSRHGEVVAIASRDYAKARAAADAAGIARAYGSYEELLADPEVDAIYNPLPNHLHVPWSVRASFLELEGGLSDTLGRAGERSRARGAPTSAPAARHSGSSFGGVPGLPLA